ncbi:hypothetical protein F5B19DRAFT_231954 [Rostrohypoxylon terebratum]|nr:hypothetical protein F5B19DRAFT_231954 [Rostrohypoxylon terebratum]
MGIQDEEPVPLEADHLDMTRYRSAGSHNCVLVLHQLREIVAGQIRCCQRRFPITIPEHLPDTSALQQRVGYNEKIEEALMPMDVPTLQPACCVLYGLGGVGKSKMALVFMEQHREVYDYMFFLGADKTPKLAQGFANIARLLKLGDAETLNDPSSARSVVLNWLQTTRRWLLVFDNVDDALVLDNFWPFRSQGAILITCRNANITSTLPQIRAKIVEIHGFAENEATKFLLNQPGIETKDAATVNASRSIAKKLGYLPMALMIIGAFASESRSTLIEIDQFLRNGAQTDLLSHESDATARLYEHTWETIWASDLASLNRKTTEFLNVISLLDPDHIPKDLFHHDMLEYIKMLMPLEKYSFVEKTNTHDLKVHRLVQHRQLDRMSNEELNMAFDSATKLVRDAFPKQILGMHMYKFWPKCEQFLPHVLAIEVAYTERHPHLTQADEFVDMMCDCSWYLFETSQLEEALQPLCTAETLCKRTIGEDSLSMARIHVGRALVLAHQNKYNEAGPLYEKALEIREKHLPQNDQLLANSYMQVALFRTHQCRLPEAITAHKKAIDIRSNSDRHAPPLMALSYINLSRCLLMTEQWGELEQVLSRSEECFRDLSAEERATHASLIGYIRGNMKLGQGKVEEALSDHLNNCERTKKAYGNHYYTAAAYHKVAVIQISLGNRSAAISSLFSALEILEKLRGASISGRKSRSEILLSNQLLLEGEAEKARAMRARAFDHYFEATGSRIEDQTNVDFDLLVPFNDR